jgi:hypothetical protein
MYLDGEKRYIFDIGLSSTVCDPLPGGYFPQDHTTQDTRSAVQPWGDNITIYRFSDNRRLNIAIQKI